ncbi:hypothetical protein RSSM_05322 [Rhodopirellula sallentina SM41]|uniref:Uncharacterized protein n=1 Tax=Rhodopirellula sallentina SM41 TaxID=1263870 RepID=M5TVL5_9BACT|nr:hypothetical protein RSSM_05322 [Rhodopirellula sallentina SM41]
MSKDSAHKIRANLICIAIVLTVDDNVVTGSRYASRQNFRT